MTATEKEMLFKRKTSSPEVMPVRRMRMFRTRKSIPVLIPPTMPNFMTCFASLMKGCSRRGVAVPTGDVCSISLEFSSINVIYFG